MSCEIEVICSDFETEEDTRNDCLDRAIAEGFDWLVIQDADEFYPTAAGKRCSNSWRRTAGMTGY